MAYDRSDAGRARDRGREWILLDGNRSVIAVALLVPFFAVLVSIELVITSTIQQIVPLFYLSGAIIGGNFTLLTIVISISQLVISRQLSAPGELEDQIEETTTYREDATELVEKEVAPATPAAFLEVLLRGAWDSVHELESHRDEIATDGAVNTIDDVLGPLGDHIERSIRRLERSGTSIFEALVITLDTNYSEDIHQIWRLETVHQDALTPGAKRELETLVTRLKDIDVARQYLKTVYIQEELSRLSRKLLYVGLPVIFSGLLMMEVFISTRRPFLSPRQLSVITPVFTTIASAPLALLFSYVLRISVVSERTAAITPFTTTTQESAPVKAVGEDADD